MDELLQECEARLVERAEVADLLTTVATEPGQLMNEADIFVHLVPQSDRQKKQQQIMAEVRADLETIEDLRVVVRDQSTEGFTAQRGDPVDFTIQGDWDKLPGYARQIMSEMAEHGGVHDIDSDYRPGMQEVRVYPNRDKAALVAVPVGRIADTLTLWVGGQRVAKFTDRGRRYDVRVRLQLPQRASPDKLAP